jgi:hypothetical protein
MLHLPYRRSRETLDARRHARLATSSSAIDVRFTRACDQAQSAESVLAAPVGTETDSSAVDQAHPDPASAWALAVSRAASSVFFAFSASRGCV